MRINNRNFFNDLFCHFVESLTNAPFIAVESSASSDESGGGAHLEVIIGVLSAVTLLLLFLFVAVLMYR